MNWGVLPAAYGLQNELNSIARMHSFSGVTGPKINNIPHTIIVAHFLLFWRVYSISIKPCNFTNLDAKLYKIGFRDSLSCKSIVGTALIHHMSLKLLLASREEETKNIWLAAKVQSNHFYR